MRTARTPARGSRLCLAATFACAAAAAFPVAVLAQEPGVTRLIFRTDGRTYINQEEPVDSPLTANSIADVLDFASGAVVGTMEFLLVAPEALIDPNPTCGTPDPSPNNTYRSQTIKGGIMKLTLPDGTLESRFRFHLRRDAVTRRQYYVAVHREFVGTGRYEHTEVFGTQIGWEHIDAQDTDWQAVQTLTIIDPFVPVVGAGNAGGGTGFGAVAEPFAIGRHEVGVRQYVHFLNAVAETDSFGLFDETLDEGYGITRFGAPGEYFYFAAPGFEERPANHVSLYDAMRFVNWLENGRPRGTQDASTTEDGAYTITQSGIDANSIAPNPGSLYGLPSEDEWYKAAHYDVAAQSYFVYPAGSDSLVCSAPTSAPPPAANCDGAVGATSELGSYPASPSPNDTFDQGGNVWEWTEDASGAERRIRGGAFDSPLTQLAASSSGAAADPQGGGPDLGLRLRFVPDTDSDGDGLADLFDNCPRAANPLQEDDGGIDTSEPDGIGNICQCGDVTGNGIVSGQDGNAIRRHALGIEPNPTFSVPGLCDVTGNGACNGQDGNAVRRAALGIEPNPLFGQQSCPSWDDEVPCAYCEP